MAFAASANNPELTRDYARVHVRRVEKRSTDQSSPSYHVSVEGLGEQVRLSLRSPSYSVFTPSFQYLEANEDPETGELQFQDFTPSQKELRSIQENFFTDVDSNAAVSLKRGANGDNSYQLSGRINDMSIINKGEDTHELIRKDAPKDDFSDYIDKNRTVTAGKQSRATSFASPEVFVIFDYANSRNLGNNRNKILDYLGVFFHAINNRFATASDPKINFRLSGVTAINSLRAQPYMENNKVSGGYNIYETLEDLATWLYSNSRTTPKYDLAALITGTDMKAQDSKGAWTSGVAGLAYLKGSCWNYTSSKQYLGSSVTEDIGGYYSGVFSVAHELAHNMGAPHDADENAEDCPWSDGYIMSYEGWGTKNKFYFSPCSLSLMKGLIDSKQGSCTKSRESSQDIPLSDDNIGDRLDMKQLCVKYTNSTEAVPDPDTSADDLCKNLKCRYPVPNKPGWYSIQTLNHPAGDDSSCGDGGKCIDGDCVV